MTTPPQPTTGDQREDQAAESGAAVAAVLAAAEASIASSMAGILVLVIGGTLGAQMARRKMRTIISAALGGASSRLHKLFAQAAEKAGGTGHLPTAPGQIGKAIITAAQDAGQAFDNAMAAALGDNSGAFRPVSDVYQKTVKAAMSEKASQLKRAQKVMDELARRGLTGFTDRTGRRWDLASYAGMVTRTAASRLHLSQQLSAMAQDGYRLVIVDNPAMEAGCPLCRPFEGTVLALSGPGSGISSITDARGVQRTAKINGTLEDAVSKGLLHPGCRHALIPWADGAGAVATAGGAPRGYVERGKTVYRSLPIGTPRDYQAAQKQRARERHIRQARLLVATALTPQAKAQARQRLAHARGTGVAAGKIGTSR